LSAFDPSRLRVRWLNDKPLGPNINQRRHTLTHSDATGDLFLTIGSEFDLRQVSAFYTRPMRDEVLAEWRRDEGGPGLHVFCHVSGGVHIGSAPWRYGIFRQHMPQVLQAFRQGDEGLFRSHPELDQASVFVHYRSHRADYARVEAWGLLRQYRLDPIASIPTTAESSRIELGTLCGIPTSRITSGPLMVCPSAGGSRTRPSIDVPPWRILTVDSLDDEEGQAADGGYPALRAYGGIAVGEVHGRNLPRSGSGQLTRQVSFGIGSTRMDCPRDERAQQVIRLRLVRWPHLPRRGAHRSADPWPSSCLTRGEVFAKSASKPITTAS